jgi:hypothetical protein
VDPARGAACDSPVRIAADLLVEREDPQAVGYVVVDALRGVYDHPPTMASALAPLASRYGLASTNGLAVLGWLLDLIDAPERHDWLTQANENPPDRTSNPRRSSR